MGILDRTQTIKDFLESKDSLSEKNEQRIVFLFLFFQNWYHTDFEL